MQRVGVMIFGTLYPPLGWKLSFPPPNTIQMNHFCLILIGNSSGLFANPSRNFPSVALRIKGTSCWTVRQGLLFPCCGIFDHVSCSSQSYSQDATGSYLPHGAAACSNFGCFPVEPFQGFYADLVIPPPTHQSFDLPLWRKRHRCSVTCLNCMLTSSLTFSMVASFES